MSKIHPKRFEVSLKKSNESGCWSTSIRESVEEECSIDDDFYFNAGLAVGYAFSGFGDDTCVLDKADFIRGFLESFEWQGEQEFETAMCNCQEIVAKWRREEGKRIDKVVQDVIATSRESEPTQ